MQSGLQWWCSASGQPWNWTWRPYPGVWLIVLAIGWMYWSLTRTAPHVTPARRIMGWIGVAFIWIALDWPLGPLGAGYAASAHALQFILLAFSAPPLIIAGLAPYLAAHASSDARHDTPRTFRLFQSRIFRIVTTPVVAGVFFNAVAAATHVPHVVDALMVSQLGAFAIDMAWLIAGLLFWWPVLSPIPARPHFPPPLQVLYLFLGSLVHTVIAIIMLMAEFPLYGIYELAPPSGWFTPLTDLGIAGGIMELVGLAIVFGMMTGIFLRWANRES